MKTQTVTRTLTALMTACFFVGFAALAADNAQPTLRVEVNDVNNPDYNVKMSMPLSIIRSLGPAFNDAVSDVQMHEDFQGRDIDFRAIWAEVRAAGPHHYVEIHQEDATVNVHTDETHLYITASGVDSGGDGELNLTNAEIKVPLMLGDVLFGDSETIDFQALIDALETMQGEDLVTVTSDDKNIRVWVQ